MQDFDPCSFGEGTNILYKKQNTLTISLHHTNNTAIPQIPQSRSDKGKDNEILLPCPPVNACKLVFEPLPADPFIGVGNVKRPVPLISKVAPSASRLKTLPPDIVTPEAPELSVTPSTTTKEDSTLTSDPSILRSDESVARGVESGIALEPRSKVPDGWRVMIVPLTVIAGPPAEMVVPAM